MDVSSVFGSQPIKRIERPKSNRSLNKTEVEDLLGDNLDDLVLESTIIIEEENWATNKSEVKSIDLDDSPKKVVKLTSKSQETTTNYVDENDKPKSKVIPSENGHKVKSDPDESMSGKKSSTPSRKRTASKTPDDSSNLFVLFMLLQNVYLHVTFL